MNEQKPQVSQSKVEEFPFDAASKQVVSTSQAPVAFAQLLQQKENALKNFLGSKENTMKFMSAVMHAIQKVPDLAKCDNQSVLAAFTECAVLGLYPSSYAGDCYVLPYKGKAQFQLGYQGVKTLAYRSGILRCGTEIVHENDEFEEILGTKQELHHKPAKGDRGKAIGAYAWAEVNKDSVIFKYMSESEIMEIKKTSPAASSQYSPWNQNDPQKWMWQKTVFKQMGKMMPKSDKLERAIYLDNVSERGGYIKDESEVVEVPFNDKFNEAQSKKEALRERRNVIQQDHE